MRCHQVVRCVKGGTSAQPAQRHAGRDVSWLPPAVPAVQTAASDKELLLSSCVRLGAICQLSTCQPHYTRRQRRRNRKDDRAAHAP